MTIWETDLPGIGRKYRLDTQEGDRLVIVIHDNGKRELYHFDQSDLEECKASITLDDQEAMQLAGIIGGMSYKPKALESPEVALNDLVIEWYKIRPDSPCVGQTIGEVNVRQKTGTTIIAIIDQHHQQHINPGSDYVFAAKDTLVLAGERHQVKKLKEMLQL